MELERSGSRLEPPAPDEARVDSPGRGVSGVDRIVGWVRSATPGPSLICVAGLHGNEPAGVLALQRFFARLGAEASLRGNLVGLAGNLGALAAGRRYLASDLNRMWSEATVDRIRRQGPVPGGEEEELAELLGLLERAFAEATGPACFLDLHTFSGPGAPFVTFDDTLRNRKIAFRFPGTLVLGLEEELQGTLSSWVEQRGLDVVGFESGQHHDPSAVAMAEAALWVAADACGLLAEPDARVEEARRALEAGDRCPARIVEVRYRYPVSAGESFEIEPGLESFQRVKKGQRIARSRAGRIHAPLSGLLLMPLYQRQGEDGFFVVRPVRRWWLGLSGVLRRSGLDRALHLLPGVRRHPREPGAFVVDPRWARLPVVQLFHLFGYRRRKEGRLLVMSRRDRLHHAGGSDPEGSGPR